MGLPRIIGVLRAEMARVERAIGLLESRAGRKRSRRKFMDAAGRRQVSARMAGYGAQRREQQLLTDLRRELEPSRAEREAASARFRKLLSPFPPGILPADGSALIQSAGIARRAAYLKYREARRRQNATAEGNAKKTIREPGEVD
ncbi:MAG TPA: hypothetical protein VMB03_11365 [Bryobacteraceae bacterium]|nr:hypothetical protein [Bryobacteraceae bacterium]